MAVSYKKLWKLLIDKDMKKKDLCAKAGISPASVTKMGRNGHVTTEILLKICTVPDGQIEEILTGLLIQWMLKTSCTLGGSQKFLTPTVKQG